MPTTFPISYTLDIKQGATYKKVFQWLDYQGQPKPLAGWRAHAQIRTAYGPTGQLVLDLSTEAGTIILTEGTIQIVLTDEQTAAIPVRTTTRTRGPSVQVYYFDLFLYDEDEKGICFLEGDVLVTGALTRAL